MHAAIMTAVKSNRFAPMHTVLFKGFELLYKKLQQCMLRRFVSSFQGIIEGLTERGHTKCNMYRPAMQHVVLATADVCLQNAIANSVPCLSVCLTVHARQSLPGMRRTP